jgi:serine/threonine-protein kinase
MGAQSVDRCRLNANNSLDTSDKNHCNTTEQVMSNDDWQKAKEIFLHISSLPKSAQSDALDTACGDLPELKQLIEGLLKGESLDSQSDHAVSKLVGAQAQDMLNNKVDEHYSADVQIGQRIGEYEVQDVLGEGGMGVVYLAQLKDAEFEQSVAIKIIKAQFMLPQTIERFRQERQILASIKHPNVAQLISGGETTNGLPYIVMEYVEGTNIIDYCRVNKLSVAQRLDMFKQVLNALSYAHQNLIIHRDIKPSNVLVTQEGTVKLLDFGIAKLIEDKELPADQSLTQVDTRVMTPSNASPEQVRREKATTRTDVYGLCTLLYQMLTEQALFDTTQATSREVEDWILEKMPTKPSANVSSLHSLEQSAMRSTLVGDLDTIILKGLQKEPELRYASVEQLQQDIQRYLTNYPILAKPTSKAYKVQKFVQRNRAFSVLSSVFVVCLIAFTFTVNYQSSLIQQERDKALREADNAVREANNAYQVTSLLTDMFKSANPLYSGDVVITPSDLVDTATQQVQAADFDPLLRGDILVSLADVYRSLAQYDKAQTLIDSAEETLSSIDSLPINLRFRFAATQSNIAYIAGKYELAFEILEPVLVQLQQRYDESKVLGNIESQTATRYFRALIYQSANVSYTNEPEALALAEKALKIATDNDINSAHDLSAVYGMLGISYRELFRNDEALLMLNKSVDYAKQAYGEINLESAYSLNQLASLYSNLEDYDSAQKMAQASYDIRVALYPDGHPEIAASLGNLANIAQNKGNIEQAIKHRIESSKIIENSLGNDHVFAAANAMALADLYIITDQYDQALEKANFALPVMKANMSDDVLDMARPYRLLGKILHYQNAHSEAIENLNYSLQIATTARPDGHWLAADAHFYLALNHHEQGNKVLAKEHKEKSILLYVKIFGEDSVRANNARDKLQAIL